MTSGLISRSVCQRMTIIVLITRASMRHLINAEGEGCGKSTNELLMMMDPSESEGEEITVIKHLIFLMSDSVAFVCPSLSPPVSSSWKISLRSSYPPLCSPFLYLCLVLCVWRTKKDHRWAMRGLLRVSVIFGCDIFITSLNVLCQPIYYLATGEEKRLSNIDRLQRMMGHEKRIREGSKGDAFSSTRFKFKFAKSTHKDRKSVV